MICREQLRRNLHVQKYHLEIVLEDLINSHLQKGLEEKLVNRPRELLPLVYLREFVVCLRIIVKLLIDSNIIEFSLKLLQRRLRERFF